MAVKIDKASIRRAIKRSKFPVGMPIDEIEKTLERDMIAALKQKGITSGGPYVLEDGPIKYDISIDARGRRRVKYVE